MSEQLNCTNKESWLLRYRLNDAIERGDLNAVDSLLKQFQTKDGETFGGFQCRGYRLLLNAMGCIKLEVARFLLDRGAAVNIDENYRPLIGRGVYDKSPLQMALVRENVELFKIMLSKGSDVNVRGGIDGETALHTAVRYHQLEAVKLLLEHKSDINSVDDYDRTPLLTSIDAKTNSLAMIQLLSEYQPDLSKRLRSLKKNECDDDPYYDYYSDLDPNGMDALLYATLETSVGTVTNLLDLGADINSTDPFGRTPLAIASAVGAEDICRLLIDRGCGINTPDKYGKSPLHYACSYNQCKVVKLLLSRGSDYNANVHGWTPLHSTATSSKNCDVFDLLLDYGVDVNVGAKSRSFDQNGIPVVLKSPTTPLHVAVETYFSHDYRKELKLMELMLEYGADVNIINSDLYSPLLTAIIRRDVNVFSFLMCYGADINQRFEKRRPLLSAVRGYYGDRPFQSDSAIYQNAIKWKTLGLATIPEEDITSIHPNALSVFKTYEERCKSELDNIRNVNIKLYLLLTKPINDITYLAEQIMDDICSKIMEDRFPLYQSIMSLRLKRVRFRFSLLQRCKDFRDWLEASLPHYCATLIVSYLGNRDLRRLSTW